MAGINYAVSICCFAELAADDSNELPLRCSWCGKTTVPLSPVINIGYDVELTLRRWKDDDCTSEEMLERLTKTNGYNFESLLEQLIPKYRKGDQPKLEYSFELMQWVERHDRTKEDSNGKK